MRDHKEFAVGLRELADFIEDNQVDGCIGNVMVWGPYDNQAAKAWIAKIAKGLGHANKEYGAYLDLSRKFSEGMTFTAKVLREAVCIRKEVGQKMVREEMVLEPRLERTVLPAVYEPIYEYDCSPLLATDEQAQQETLAGLVDGMESHTEVR